MAENNLSAQHTLYRMVSLRNPEKLIKEKKETRFVFYFDGQKELQEAGLFYKAVKTKSSSKTKWQALNDYADIFKTSAFSSETDVENINNTFFAVSDWIAKNRSTAKPEEILLKIDGLTPLETKKIESNLWDNLFYTVVTDKNHYVKEAVIQMLVLQNLLKQNPSIDNIISLANANVVLPLDIFEEDEQTTTTTQVAKKADNNISIPQSLIDAQEIQKAKNDLEILNSLKKGILKIETKQKSEFQKKYNQAQSNYQKQIKPIVDKFNKDFATEKFQLNTLAQTNKDINTNLINIPFPELPEFSFDTPTEIDSDAIENKLSKNLAERLNEIIDWNEIESFEEIYTSLDEEIKKTSQKVIENNLSSTQYATFGDMIFPVAKAAVSDLSFVICSQQISTNNFAISITINTSSSAHDMSYYVKFQDGTTSLPNSTVINTTSAILKLDGFFGANGFTQNPANPVVGFFAEFKLSDNNSYSVSLDDFPFTKYNCTRGYLALKDNSTSPSDDLAPKGFGFRQIGIADYKKVVTEICGYRAGEVAHIENIMAGETREKVTTKTHISEVTDTSSTEIETEKLSDTTSTERFEMQTEIAKMIQEQTALDAHANVRAGGVGWSLDAGAAYATNTTKEQSNRQAVTQAKEQTQRAMERIVSRIKTTKTVKITDEFVEANKHRFENVTNPSNVSGVYRFINAVYKNQIYNYGKRLMYEFMVPQPSKLHRLGLQVSVANNDATLLSKPTDPRIAFPSFDAIDQNNYKSLIAKYNVSDVIAYPVDTIKLSEKHVNNQWANNGRWNMQDEFEVKIPEGYYVENVKGLFKTRNGFDPDNSYVEPATWANMNGVVIIGGQSIYFSHNNENLIDLNLLNKITNKLEITTTTWDVGLYNFNLIITCKLTDSAIYNWKKATYEAILKGYEIQLEAYNEQLASIKAEGAKLLDSNPLFYRETEQLILRKNCISYLIDNTNTTTARRFGIEMYNDGATFENHQVTISKTMDDYTSFAKFMEQAFEWNLMSYNFYPFYWGNSTEWKDLYQFETNDPTYRSFMQAGMARVVVTVKPGFENAVMHYMAFGQIWNGGQTPILGNPLYLSIVDELKEQEYYIEDIWETVVPTNLVALQESGVSIAGGGLPNADSCVEHADKKVIENKSTLTVTSSTK